MVFNNHLYLLILRKLGIKFAEHFLSIEASGNEEDEVRRLLRHYAAELVCELLYLLGLHGHTAFVLISDEDDFLDVTRKPLLLDVSPLLFLRICRTALVEEHVSDADKQDNVQPGDTESYSHGFVPARRLVVFCHSLC